MNAAVFLLIPVVGIAGIVLALPLIERVYPLKHARGRPHPGE
jgi:hypothetical protein